MDITLYYAGPSRATRARWILEELREAIGVEHRLVPVQLVGRKRFERDAEFLRVSPYGTVPALEIDGATLFESQAILLYLADRFPEARLAPAVDAPQRARYLNLVSFACTTLENPLWKMARHGRLLPEEFHSQTAVAHAKHEFGELKGVVEELLAGAPCALGEQFSAADIALAHTLSWARRAGVIEEGEPLDQWAATHRARPALKRAMTAPPER